jgi:hypothetical protein
VEQAGAFKSQRNGREIGQRKHLFNCAEPPSSYQTTCGGAAATCGGARRRLRGLDICAYP